MQTELKLKNNIIMRKLDDVEYEYANNHIQSGKLRIKKQERTVIAIGEVADVKKNLLLDIIEHAEIEVLTPKGVPYTEIERFKQWFRNYITGGRFLTSNHIDNRNSIFTSWKSALKVIGNPKYAVIYYE